MVYYLSLQNSLPFLPANWKQYLPSYRIEKALSYKQEKDTITCVLSFLLLRYALYKEYNSLAMPQLATDENGKPFDVSGEYHFNLSHCDAAVACALHCAPAGVDVQDYRPVKHNVVQRVCSLQEQEMLAECVHPERTFAALWASKEAYGKYTGQGIGYALNSVSFCDRGVFPCICETGSEIICTDIKDGFALSVCAQQRLQLQEVSMDELLCFLQLL